MPRAPMNHAGFAPAAPPNFLNMLLIKCRITATLRDLIPYRIVTLYQLHRTEITASRLKPNHVGNDNEASTLT